MNERLRFQVIQESNRVITVEAVRMKELKLELHFG